jgi:hypothetical protein
MARRNAAATFSQPWLPRFLVSLGHKERGSRHRSSTALYKNCTALNKKYPHGVGKTNARDKTTGTPVTTFMRSNSLYRTAMRWNSRLDRDKDGIACEKA